jgi:hypothetical protein
MDVEEDMKKEAEKIWEEELKNSFEEKLKQCAGETMNKLKEEMDKFDKQLNQYLQELNKNFENKLEKSYQNEFKELDKKIKEFEQLKKSNFNDIQQNNFNKQEIKEENNFKDNNNNEDNDNNDNNFKPEEIYNDIKKNLENIDNNQENQENQEYNIKEEYEQGGMEEEEENDKEEQFNINELKEPKLTHLLEDDNMNPLISLILQILCNMKNIVCYYLDPLKKEKILQKSKNEPEGIYLSPTFLDLLVRYWNGKEGALSIFDIYSAIHNLLVSKKIGYISDAGFLMSFILNQLHFELNQNDKNSQKEPSMENDYYFRDKILEFKQKSFALEKTFISDTFFSRIEIRKRCRICDTIKYTFELTPVINIYLEYIKFIGIFPPIYYLIKNNEII